MSKTREHASPSWIDDEELQELRKQAALRRKITEEVERQMGLEEEDDSRPRSFDEWLKTLPQDIDVDDSIFARHIAPGEPNVSG